MKTVYVLKRTDRENHHSGAYVQYFSDHSYRARKIDYSSKSRAYQYETIEAAHLEVAKIVARFKTLANKIKVERVETFDYFEVVIPYRHRYGLTKDEIAALPKFKLKKKHGATDQTRGAHRTPQRAKDAEVVRLSKQIEDHEQHIRDLVRDIALVEKLEVTE